MAKLFPHILIVGLLIFASPGYAVAQQKVSGSIKDTQSVAIPHAGIALKNEKGFVLAFSQSDEFGSYSITLSAKPTAEQLFVEVYLLGYKKSQQRLEPNKLSYNFVLVEQTIDLKEVQIKRKPTIVTKGDTLSYNVSSFSRPEDRSIGEVITRLPGVAVAENGQISFNGKTISNLFIHGDDLMDGRYGMATRVISKEMIASIDIIQNFQPIKVLQNKVFTDEVAMNLVLRDENKIKLGGQAMLGTGLPKQYDVAFNGMVFNKRFKMLNAAQANNSGVDYWNDLEQLGTALGAPADGNPKPKAILSANTIGSPDLPKFNYYLNRSQMVNLNNLYNLKNGLQVKANVQVLLDKTRMSTYSRLTNYLLNDTVNFFEQQRGYKSPKRVNIALTAMQNKQQYFLNNKMSVNLESNNAEASLDFNNKPFRQYLEDHGHQFSNDFSFTPSLKGKNVLDFRWTVSYFENPQVLRVDTGLNAEILNNNVPLAALRQDVKVPTFISNAVVGYRLLNDGTIKHNYQIGMLNERQSLSSALTLNQFNGSANSYGGDVGNDLKWERDRFFINAEYTVKKEKWDAGLSIPLSLQSIRYQQEAYQLDESKNQLLLNPLANLRVHFNSEDYLRLSYGYQNAIGDISTIYRGAILFNYRTVLNNKTLLQQNNIQVATLQYNFQRSIMLLFINATLNHKSVEANSIVSTVIDNNIQQTVLLPLKNKQDVLSADLGLSKYVFALSATVKLQGRWNRTRYDQFVNQTRLPYNNYLQSYSVGIGTKFFGALTVDYQGRGTWNESKSVEVSEKGLNNKARRIEQAITLGYTPFPNLNFNVDAKNVLSSQANISTLNYTFFNTRLRYKWVKLRTDISFDLSNIMNIKRYDVIYLSSNQFAVNSYELRGRMGILRAAFTL